MKEATVDYLGDTNILLRLSQPADPLYPVTRQAFDKLHSNGHRVVMTPQNGVEFWNAVTRPRSRNGYEQTPQEADRLLRYLHRIFPLLQDAPGIYDEWQRLVLTYQVSGKQVHDARLVAFMLHYNLSHILTFNVQDFVRYGPEGIPAIHPADI